MSNLTPPPLTHSLCAICEEPSAMHICAECDALGGPQRLIRQRDWESWEPQEREPQDLSFKLITKSKLSDHFQVPNSTSTPLRGLMLRARTDRKKAYSFKVLRPDKLSDSLLTKVLWTTLVILAYVLARLLIEVIFNQT